MRIRRSMKLLAKRSTMSTAWRSMPDVAVRNQCAVRDLGRMSYSDALEIQLQIANERKQGHGVDHLLFVEHPHVVTIGRNGHEENLLASGETLRTAGIEVFE